MTIKNVVDHKFRQLVLDSEKPTLLAFRASWCLPSQDLIPIIDEIADEYGDRLQIVVVDADEKTEVIRRRFQVNRLPVTMLIDEGRCIDLIGGMTSKDNIVQMIEGRLRPVSTVDEMNFEAEVLQSRIPVLVHFDAAWCEQSRLLIPHVDEVAQKFRKRVRVVRVDFGPATARLCSKWGVQRVPTLALFVDGQIRDRLLGGLIGGTKVGSETKSCVGLTSVDNIADMLERVTI
jgi:thioredoxin 1